MDKILILDIILLSVLVRCQDDFLYLYPLGSYNDENDHENLFLFRAVDERNIKFFIYNRLSPDGYRLYRGDTKRLQKSGFNYSYPTKIIIHGYMNNYISDAIQLPKDAYLSIGDYNVIAVDWSDYTFPYVAAANNARPVGHIVGRFISFLMKNGDLNVNDLHIIGHSLGAHVAAFSVETITGKVKPARITGLDPAAPIFSENPPIDRLDATDAIFVDIIHTSIRLLGMIQSIGHVDFYPAGGKHQPRCPADIIEEVIGSCDHGEAYVYFAESIRNKNMFKGIKCNSLDDALNKRCRGRAEGIMGEDAILRTPRGMYYVNVNAISRYSDPFYFQIKDYYAKDESD